eukprot:650027-Amphidinium_carterae.1
MAKSQGSHLFYDTSHFFSLHLGSIMASQGICSTTHYTLLRSLNQWSWQPRSRVAFNALRSRATFVQ